MLTAYRAWIRAVRPRQRDVVVEQGAIADCGGLPQAPEIQTMYSIPQPVSAIRTRIRQEFERHRFVNKLPVVDMLLLQNNADYQVSGTIHGTFG